MSFTPERTSSNRPERSRLNSGMKSPAPPRRFIASWNENECGTGKTRSRRNTLIEEKLLVSLSPERQQGLARTLTLCPASMPLPAGVRYSFTSPGSARPIPWPPPRPGRHARSVYRGAGMPHAEFGLGEDDARPASAGQSAGWPVPPWQLCAMHGLQPYLHIVAGSLNAPTCTCAVCFARAGISIQALP